MAHAQTSETPRAPWLDRALMGGLLLTVMAGLAGLAAATGWEATLAQLARMSAVALAILLALSAANYALRALRWHLFATTLGLPTGARCNGLHYLAGFAMTVTPGRVGELIRMRWLARETGWGMDRTAPLALVDRAADLAGMGIVLGVALAFSTLGHSTLGSGLALPVAALAILSAFAVTRPRLLAALVSGTYRLTGLFPRLMARVRGAARSLSHFSNPRVLAAAGALSLICWLAEGYAFTLVLGWMGHALPFWTATAIFLFATLAGGLTGAPGGIGGAEAAMVALLALEGVPLEVAVPATAIIRLTTLWFAIAIGVVLFPVAERKASRAALAA